jgi:hypothetical protein
MSIIEKAREVVKNYSFQNDLIILDDDTTYYNGSGTFLCKGSINEIFAGSLHHFIQINEKKITDENGIQLSASKLKGLPSLPPNFKWPEGYYFYGQFNFKELTVYDIDKIFPSDGMLYLFFDPANYNCKAFYYDNIPDDLIETQYPKRLKFYSNYLSELKDNPKVINFENKFTFYMDSHGIEEMIPDKLKKNVEDVLKFEFSPDKTTRILGRPLFEKLEEPNFVNENVIDETEINNYYKSKNNILLLQDYFGEGKVSFWIDKKNLENKNFNECFVTFFLGK